MKRIHKLVTNWWRGVLLVFTLLTVIFSVTTNYHVRVVGEDNCFKPSIREKGSPQAFTSALQFVALDGAEWRAYAECIQDNPTARSLNIWVFLLDDVWAIFFIAAIYLLANYRDFRRTPLKRVLFWTLFLAYFFDLVENTIYLTLREVSVLPTIGTLKLLFYGLAILLALTAGAGNYLRSMAKDKSVG